MPKTLVLVADGSEEMETVIVVDVLRRAGWDVTIAAVGAQKLITASRRVVLEADCTLRDVDAVAFDLLFMPGGKGGAETFATSPLVQKLIQVFDKSGKGIAAICAAPLALYAAGILHELRYTCYPGVEADITDGIHSDAEVVHDRNLTTSKGPGTAFAFALELVERYDSAEKAKELSDQMVLTG